MRELGVVLLTGGTRGIGEAAVRELATRGWEVVFAGRDEVAGRELANDVVGATFVPVDLREPGAASSLVAEAVRVAGRLDALVNNAGVHDLATAEDTTDEAWDDILAVNLRVPFQLARAVVPHLAANGGGTIVNVASEAGLTAVPGQVAYNVSKAGLIMLTRSLAVDHATQGVRAVSVCPGTTMTPLVEAAIDAAADPAAHERHLASSRPAGRLGRPEEIAAAIAFALDPAVTFMTGSEVVVDGGFTVA